MQLKIQISKNCKNAGVTRFYQLVGDKYLTVHKSAKTSKDAGVTCFYQLVGEVTPKVS